RKRIRIVGRVGCPSGEDARGLAELARNAVVNRNDAARGVEELVRRRLFQVVGERLDFTHGRIRTVIYDRLLPPSRKVLHGAVARAIEAIYTAALDIHAPALGLHYREGGIWDRAVIFLARAATQALSRSAFREQAQEHLTTATTMYREMGMTYWLEQ